MMTFVPWGTRGGVSRWCAAKEGARWLARSADRLTLPWPPLGLDALSNRLERSWHDLPMFRIESLRKAEWRVSPAWTAAVWVAISAGFGSAVPASAGECEIPVAAAPALAAQTPDARLRFISQTLLQTARSERRYAVGWSLVYTGLAGGAAVGASVRAIRASMWNRR